MKYTNVVVILLIGLTGLFGCATISQPEPTEAFVDIFYATDRNLTGSQDPKYFYGIERGEMHYGICKVAVNIKQSKSEFADYSIWNLGYKNQPDKRGELRELTSLEKSKFFKEFITRINNSKDKTALVYIHGYYRTFEIAAKTAATLVYEIKYQGLPVLFSWPSRHELSAYHGDVTSIDWSTTHLRTFLDELALKTNVQTIHVIAHSMGNRGFVNAFVDLLKNPTVKSNWKFGEIILVAPDLDRQIFERDIAPVITDTPSRITLYVSAIDIPLWASKAVNLYPRLGDVSEEPVIIKGIQTVDASDVTSLSTGHTYYRESPSAMADLYYLINQRKDATQRPTLKTIDTPNGQYWKIQEYFPAQ